MLALYWRGKLGEGDFSNRNRIELRYFEGSARNRSRYRNEPIRIAPRSYGSHRLTPLVEEESFYDISDSELNETWLTLGISKFWDKGKKRKPGYRLQSRKTGG